MGKQYIHYGSSELREIEPIRNRLMFVKPDGGLWASPVDSERGWKDWCEANDFQVENLKEHFLFELTDDAKILHIYSAEQLDNLPQAALPEELAILKMSSFIYLDFEALEKEYDGIELHLSEEKYDPNNRGFGEGLYYRLYGWDCDSILIFHSHIIKLES